MKVYYINLDRSTDRREAMEAAFGEHEELVRVAGIDGLQWADGEDRKGFPLWDEKARVDLVKKGVVADGASLPPTHVANGMSHRTVMEMLLASKDESCVVLEDDVCPTEELEGMWEQGANLGSGVQMPDGCDVYYLCGASGPDRLVRTDVNGFVRKVRTSAGYIITRNGADAFLRATSPLWMLSDVQFPLSCYTGMAETLMDAKHREKLRHEKDVARWAKNTSSLGDDGEKEEKKFVRGVAFHIESRDSIVAFAPQGVGLVMLSEYSKESLLGH